MHIFEEVNFLYHHHHFYHSATSRSSLLLLPHSPPSSSSLFKHCNKYFVSKFIFHSPEIKSEIFSPIHSVYSLALCLLLLSLSRPPSESKYDFFCTHFHTQNENENVHEHVRDGQKENLWLFVGDKSCPICSCR